MQNMKWMVASSRKEAGLRSRLSAGGRIDALAIKFRQDGPLRSDIIRLVESAEGDTHEKVSS